MIQAHKILHAKIIGLLLVSAVSLVLFRVFYFGSTHFLFLLWNLFLAIVPLGIVWIFFSEKKYSKAVFLFGMIVWFLFLPNALYLVSDLIHLKLRTQESIYFTTDPMFWTDLIMLFWVSLTGVIVSVVALHQGTLLIRNYFGKTVSMIVLYSTLVLSGFGVYVGRFARLNSWHIFTQPNESWQVLYQSIEQIISQKEAYVFVALFTFLFGISYLVYVQIIKSNSKE